MKFNPAWWTQVALFAVACSAAFPLRGGPGITPSGLEINLGPVPIDLYNSAAAHPSDTFPDCPAAYTVRQCVKRMFVNVPGPANPEYAPKNYIRQGVTGVRVMLTIGGGYYSTPYPNWKTDPSSVPSAAWSGAVNTFFQDLRSWGVLRVTPTPIVREHWSRSSNADWRAVCPPGMPAGQHEANNCTPRQLGEDYGYGSGGRPLKYLPWSPYGYVHGPFCAFEFLPGTARNECIAANDDEDGVGDSQAYVTSPENPFFGSGPGKWGGWAKFINMMDKLFELAALNDLQLGDVDLVNELHPILLSVQGRFVFDNKAGVDVLAQIQQRLVARGFNPGLATYSVFIDRPSASKGASAYCRSQFGNWGGEASGLIPFVAALSNLVGGAPFGLPAFEKAPSEDTDSLRHCLNEPARATACPDPATRESCRYAGLPMAPIDSSRVPMTAINMHSHVCKAAPWGGPSTGNGCTLEDSTQIAKATYDAVQIYMDSHGRSSNLVVFGETNSNQVRNSNGFTPAHARWNVSGFLQSTLYAQKGANVRLRPWIYVAGEAYESPHSLASYGTDGPPVVVSITPANAQYVEASGPRSFTVLVRHPGLASSISKVELLFNREESVINGCLIEYFPQTGAHVLWNDAGTATVPGANGLFQNSECSIASAVGVISHSQTQQELAITVPVSFRAAQSRLAWARAFDASTGTPPYSSQVVRGPVSSRPIVVSASPAGSSGSQATPLSIAFRHPTHSEELNVMNVLIRNVLDANEACYVTLEKRENKISLAVDYPTPTNFFVGSYQANTIGGMLQNSRCRITSAANEVFASSGNLFWNLNVEFFSNFAGDKIVHVAGRDMSLELVGGASGDFGNSGWQRLGVWSVPSFWPAFPRTNSHAPSTGSGMSQTFTTFFERSSAAQFSRGWVLFQDYLDGRNACYVAYAADQNLLYLVNDDGTGVLPAITPGTASSQSNSQCTINGAASVAAQAGNIMVLVLDVSFKPEFAGRRVAYTASQTVDGATSPWQSKGTWLIP